MNDDTETKSTKHLSCSTFDSHCAEYHGFNKQSLSKLLSQVQKSVSNMELQQFVVSTY